MPYAATKFKVEMQIEAIMHLNAECVSSRRDATARFIQKRRCVENYCDAGTIANPHQDRLQKEIQSCFARLRCTHHVTVDSVVAKFTDNLKFN